MMVLVITTIYSEFTTIQAQSIIGNLTDYIHAHTHTDLGRTSPIVRLKFLPPKYSLSCRKIMTTPEVQQLFIMLFFHIQESN